MLRITSSAADLVAVDLDIIDHARNAGDFLGEGVRSSPFTLANNALSAVDLDPGLVGGLVLRAALCATSCTVAPSSR